MFGPDICGYSTKRIHVIFNYKGKNHLINKDVKCKDDELTHICTLVVTPDNKYKVLVDNEETAAGSLEEDWDFLPAKKIKDPEASKPSQDEWDEREEIADPDDTKPDDWEKPEHIADPDAAMPEDWDEGGSDLRKRRVNVTTKIEKGRKVVMNIVSFVLTHSKTE